MRRLALSLMTMLTAVTAGGWALAASATAAEPAAPALADCAVAWGSLDKVAEPTATSPLVDVRVGRHACFDRLVLDFRGATDGYRVRYVDQVTMDGSGEVVPLRGGARLEVVAIAPAYDEDYRPTYTPANRAELGDVSGWSTFRQVAWAGSFEGQTTIGVGVRARLPFRVLALAGPGSGSRLVLDVAHVW